MMDHLLLWMSARANGTMAALRSEIARAETEQGVASSGFHAALTLSRLGHIELGDPGGGGWTVCPPVVAARQAAGSASGILCGARTPALLDTLNEVAQGFDTKLTRTPQDGAPEVIELTAASLSSLKATANAAGVLFQPRATRALLAAAGSLKSLPLEATSLPIGRGWEVTRYSASGLRWTSSKVEAAAAASRGLFRFRSDYQTQIFLKDAEGVWRCPPDVGKYRLLERRHKPLAYSARRRTLYAALGARPPTLFERALVIASGKAPGREGSWLVYEAIELADAQALAAQLGQKLY